MKPISLNQLARILNGRFLVAPSDQSCLVDQVSIDTRTLQSGQVFFAIKGPQYDGHKFLEQAERNQAACAVIDNPGKTTHGPLPVLRVENTTQALADLADWYRNQLKAKVVAITGSAGKTSTRQILNHVLSAHYRCCQSPKSFNNLIGVPLTILAADPNCQILLVEIGSNHPGEIAPLSKITRPDLVVITSIGPAHLEGFGSIEAIIQEKASILKGLAPDGKAILNGDNLDLLTWVSRKYSNTVITVGSGSHCDLHPEHLHTSGSSGWFTIQGKTVHVPLAGRAMVANVLTALSVCQELDIALSDFIQEVRTIEPIRMRLQVEHIGPVTVIIDCYNANPPSMENALETLAQMASKQNRRPVFIAGDMAELGIHSDSLHEQIGRFALRQGVQVFLAAGRYGQMYLKGAKKTDNLTQEIPQMRTFGTVETLCRNVHNYLLPDDIILIKASRASRMEQVVDRLRELFESGKQYL